MVKTPDPASLGRARAALVAGDVVAIPTDTVYGLAARADTSSALERIFELKDRPADFALPVLVADLAQASLLVGDNPSLELVAARFWPGPLTVIVRPRGSVPGGVGGDGVTLGLRCPDDDAIRALCADVGPLAVTSANRHGQPAATTVADVVRAFGNLVTVVVDGGVRDGEPSSVISLAGPTPVLLRAGLITIADVVAALSGS